MDLGKPGREAILRSTAARRQAEACPTRSSATVGPSQPRNVARSISFELPAAVEETLRRDHGNLDVLAKEAAVVELFRQGKISRRELETSLDLTRFEAGALLKHCGVTEDLATAEEVAQQISTLRRLLAG